MLRHLAIFLAIVAAYPANAQRDSSVMEFSEGFSDRIYLSHEAFRRNYFISKEQVVSHRDKESPRFLNTILDSTHFVFLNDTEKITMECSFVWGFFQKGVFYYHFDGAFCRVPIFGSISYFASKTERLAVDNVRPGFVGLVGINNNPGQPYLGRNTMVAEGFDEFIVDFRNNEVTKYNLRNLKELLSKDEGLYARLMELNRIEQKQQAFYFIKQYNSLHSIYMYK